MHTKQPPVPSRRSFAIFERIKTQVKNLAKVLGAGLIGRRSCYICISTIVTHEYYVCQKCRQIWEKHCFFGCTRCGSATCGGMCEKLDLFATLRSLYWFRGSAAEIVNMAKWAQLRWAQLLMHELLFDKLQSTLKTILEEQKIDLIVVAPLSVRRILSLQWHPASIIISSLSALGYRYTSMRKLKDAGANNNNFKGQRFFICERNFAFGNAASKSTKSRSIAAGRLQEQLQLRSQTQKVSNFGTPDANTNKLNILFIDDVLTTGNTAIKCLIKLNKILSTSHQLQFHLLTLFRTPKSTKTN